VGQRPYGSYGLKKVPWAGEYMGMMRHTFVVDRKGSLSSSICKVKAEEMGLSRFLPGSESGLSATSLPGKSQVPTQSPGQAL